MSPAATANLVSSRNLATPGRAAANLAAAAVNLPLAAVDFLLAVSTLPVACR